MTVGATIGVKSNIVNNVCKDMVYTSRIVKTQGEDARSEAE